MSATSEYASVTVAVVRPDPQEFDGKVTAKLLVLSYQALGGSCSDPSTADDPSLT